MDAIYWYAVAGGLILVWMLGLNFAFKRWSGSKSLEAKGFSPYGPFLMWRTMRGRGLIERLSRRKALWGAYGDLAIALCAVVAVAMMLLLFWTASRVPSMSADDAPDPENMIGIPGLNKFIPIWYGIFGLAIAMIVHEGAHGILMRAGAIRLESLGLLFLIFPMGAFAEQDEGDMAKAPRRVRMRAYAVGPAANLIVAGICVAVFAMVLMPCVTPVNEGRGIGVVSVSDGTPADAARLEAGMVIVSFNGTTVDSRSEFIAAINAARAGDTVPLQYFIASNGTTWTANVTLADKAAYTKDSADSGKGYLGVVTTSLTTDHFHPIGDARDPQGILQNSLTFVVLPLAGLSPVQGATAEFYEISGPLDPGAFWLLANAVYWVFWLNLMVGLTNALPAYPLDGGFLFKDWLESLGERLGLADETREARAKAVDKIVVATSFLVLFLILWQLIGPRIL